MVLRDAALGARRSGLGARGSALGRSGLGARRSASALGPDCIGDLPAQSLQCRSQTSQFLRHQSTARRCSFCEESAMAQDQELPGARCVEAQRWLWRCAVIGLTESLPGSERYGSDVADAAGGDVDSGKHGRGAQSRSRRAYLNHVQHRPRLSGGARHAAGVGASAEVSSTQTRTCRCSRPRRSSGLDRLLHGLSRFAATRIS